MRSVTLLLLSVAVLLGGADGKKDSKEDHSGRGAMTPPHHDSKLKQDRTDVEEGSPDGSSLDSLQAELQGYLNQEKEDDGELGKDKMEMMENEGDDNAGMMKEDDAEVMNNRDEIDGNKEMVDDDNAEIEEMWEQEEPSDDDESELVRLNEQPPSGVSVNQNRHVDMQWRRRRRRRRRWGWRRRRRYRCNCNGWKRYYYRERNTKNYYYRLYVANHRHYINIKRKYHAYYRYYRRCYHRNRTCKSKYHRLRYGYKYLLKSYSHVYHTCKNRG